MEQTWATETPELIKERDWGCRGIQGWKGWEARNGLWAVSCEPQVRKSYPRLPIQGPAPHLRLSLVLSSAQTSPLIARERLSVFSRPLAVAQIDSIPIGLKIGGPGALSCPSGPARPRERAGASCSLNAGLLAVR